MATCLHPIDLVSVNSLLSSEIALGLKPEMGDVLAHVTLAHQRKNAENVSIAEVMSFHIMPMNMSHSCKFGGYVVLVGWLVG